MADKPAAGIVDGLEGGDVRESSAPTRPAGGRQGRVLLVAPDKFRGSLTAPEVVEASSSAPEGLGWQVIGMPMADGGDGMLDAFGGPNRPSVVTGPLGKAGDSCLADGCRRCRRRRVRRGVGPGTDRWRGDEEPHDGYEPGTGELIAEAVLAGARAVVVC